MTRIPPDSMCLATEIQKAVRERGYYMLSKEDIERVTSGSINRAEQLRRLIDFATDCDAECELDSQMRAGRLLPRVVSNDPEVIRLMSTAQFELTGFVSHSVPATSNAAE